MRIRNRRHPRQIRTRRMHVERLEDRQLLSIVPGLLATGICDNEGDVFAIEVDYQDVSNSDVEYLGSLTGPTGYEDLTVRDIAYSFSGDTFYGIGDDVDTYPPYTPVGWPSLLATADVDIVTPLPSGEIGFTILGGLLNPEQDMSGQLLPVWANALEVNPANGKLYAAGAHMEVGLPPTSNHYAIYEVDVASATGLAVPATPVVDLGTYQSAGDIAFDDDGYLYLTTTDSALLKVDVLSATPSIVGEVVTDTGYGDFDGLTRGFGGGEFFGFRHDGTAYAFDVPGNDSTQVGSEALAHVELDDLYGATVAFMEPVAVSAPIDGRELLDQQPTLGQLWYEFQADNDGDLSVDLTGGGTLMTLFKYDAVGDEWVELDSGATQVAISDAEEGAAYLLHVEDLTDEADLLFSNGGAVDPPPRITGIDELPQDGGVVLRDTVASLTVHFSEEMNQGTVENPDNWELLEAGDDAAFDTGDDAAYAFSSLTYHVGEAKATLAIDGGPLPIGLYRLTAEGDTSLQDTAGNPLDGNSDGSGGDDYVTEFVASIGFGVAGDSLSDEYAEETYDYAQNWVESLAQSTVYVGEYREDPATWPDVRGEGYQYNWAVSGATSDTLLSGGQHTGLAQQVDDGLVTHAVLAIGQNDFFPLGAAYEAIYLGTWDQGDIDAYNDGVAQNVDTALATLTATDVKLVLSNVIDYGVAPSVRAGAPDVAGRQRVADAIGELNDRIEVLAADYQVPLVDSFGLTKTYLGEHGAEVPFQWIGGVQINNTAGADPHNGFVADGLHPHTVLQAFFANTFVEALNIGYGTQIDQFTDEEMLTLTGLGAEYDELGQSLAVNYADYVILPPTDTGSISNLVWNDLNADGIQQAGEPGVENVLVELFDAGPDGLYGGGDDVSMGTDATDTSGFYGFGGLPAGTYYLEFSNLPAGYAFTLQDVGADDAVDSDVYQAGYATGVTEAFTLADGATDDTRDAGIVNAFSSPTVIPDPVEFEVLESQVPDAYGQLRYQFTAFREGMVSARVDYAGDCMLALYDSDQNLLDLDTSSRQQVDYSEAYAGDVFYLHVAGLASPADVAVANLLEYDTGTGSVTVHGTDGPDEFTGVYQAAPNPHEMWINGFYYDSDWFFFELNEIAFDGGDGDDTAVISGSDQSDEGVLGPYSATMYANGDAADYDVKLVVSNTESIDVDAAGGEDTGTLNGGAGVETLDLWPGYCEWEGNPFTHIVRNVEILTANGAGDDDTASMRDSTGADDFEADPDSATLSGPGYTHTVNDFRWVFAFASDDGQTDTATLDDLPGSQDSFRCWSTEAKLTGTGFFNRAKGFDEVVGRASDASDEAEMNDSAGADSFEAYADLATMTYPGGKTVEADGFRHVYASASDDGETDTARLYDTTADLGTAYPAWFQSEADASKMYYGTLFFNRAKGFDQVVATAVHGNNKGRMYDSPGPDTFEAYADSATMTYAGGPTVQADGIRWLFAYGSDDGETDTAHLYDTTADLGTSYASWFKGYHGEGKMYEVSTFYNRVDDFDEVIASAVGGDDKTKLYDSPGDDTFDGYADRSTMSYADGTMVRADGFRWLFGFASDDGETDTARLYDTTADLGTSYATWFKGFSDLSKMYEVSTFYNRVDDFNEVIASAVGGNDTAKLFDSPGADALEAYADQATMSYPDGTTVRADDFRWVLGYGSDDGQVDTAQFYDTTADLGTSYATWFKAENGFSRFYEGAVFYVQAQQFDRVSATAVASDDTAKLFDSALDDTYWSRPDHSRMEYADGTYVEALDFRYVLSYSRYGSDKATLYDETAGGTSYAARFAGYATWSKLYHGAFYSRTEGFAELRAALGGGDDLAWLEDDPARVDHLLVTFPGDVDHAAAKAKLSNTQRAIYIDDFHTLTATTSQDSVDDADIDPAYEDDVILSGNWAEAP